MKQNKVKQIQRIARLEKLFTQMYLKLEAYKIRLEQIEQKDNGDKTTR